MSRGPRPRERRVDFFTAYFRPGRPRWRLYRYQHLLGTCREWAFSGLRGAPPGVVVELGCGTGSTAGDANPARLGVDIVRCHPPSLPLILADAQLLPFGTETLAGVWNQTFLMHVCPQTVAREVHRVLVPGGVWAVVEPLARHPIVRVVRRCLPGRRSHPHYLTWEDLCDVGRAFAGSHLKPFFLFSPLAALIGHTRVARRLQELDRALLRAHPNWAGYAWYGAGWFVK